MRVIEKLENGKFGPVHIIDHLAINLPGRIWLTKIEQKSMSMTIDGKALDNISISKYMVNLAKSDYFKSVDLKKIKTDKKKGPTGIQLKNFSLTSTVTYTPGIEEKKEGTTKKKREEENNLLKKSMADLNLDKIFKLPLAQKSYNIDSC